MICHVSIDQVISHCFNIFTVSVYSFPFAIFAL